MKNFSRRDFLKIFSLGAGSLALQPSLSPSTLMAQSGGSGEGKNLVIINQAGGVDGLYQIPYVGGISNTINTALRPSLHITPTQALAFGGQGGLPNPIGFHPAFAPLLNIAASRTAVIKNYGIVETDPGRSHDTCQILMSLGVSQFSGPDRIGFLARIMDLFGWETFQYWALSPANSSDTNTTGRSPVVLEQLESLDFPQIGWENEHDVNYATNTERALLQAQVPTSALGSQYTAQMSDMHDTVVTVRNDIISQTVGNNTAGNYSESTLGNSLKNAAQVIRAKDTNVNFNQRDKNTIILTSQHGYDTHSDQANPNQPEWSVGSRFQELASNLAVFYQDLDNFNVLTKTVVILYSEFGRTNFQNASASSAGVGTDHGRGNLTFVLGGPVQAGVYGSDPTNTELQDMYYNALVPTIDYRDIFGDALVWMGINPEDIFEYTRSPIGFI